MKRRLVAIITTVCLLLSLCGSVLLSAGAVEEYIPFVHEMGSYPEARTLRVAAQEDLEYLSEIVLGGQRLEGYTFLQVADITMEGEFTPIGENYDNDGDYNFSNSFKGTYDGQGHTISNLVINMPETNGVGLFGSAIGATIMNLGIESGTVTGKNRVGAIAGYADNSTLINCYNKASVKSTGGTDGTAGIAGVARNYAYIYGCYNLGKITAQSWALAGISGWGQGNLTLHNCYSGGMLSVVSMGDDDHLAVDPIARNGSSANADYSDSLYLAGICDDSYNSWKATKVTSFNGAEVAYVLNTARGINNNCFTVDAEGNLKFRKDGDACIIAVEQRVLRSGVRLQSDKVYYVGDGTYKVPAQVGEFSIQSAKVGNVTYEVGESIELNGRDVRVELVASGSYPSVADADTVQSDVYTVSNADELAEMAGIVNNGNSLKGKKIYVTADLDFKNYRNWDPIGMVTESPSGVPDANAKPFAGVFDGQYYHFKNIEFEQSGQYQALFRFTEGATLQNFVIEEGSLTSDSVRPAGVVSLLRNSTLRNVESHLNVYSTGTANSINAALVALSPLSIIENCINYGQMGADNGRRQENAGITACGYESNTLCNNIVAGPVYGTESALIARRTNGNAITHCFAVSSPGMSGTIAWKKILSGEAAWMLNTANGSRVGSGIWAQAEYGPTLDPDHAVYRVKYAPTDSYHEMLDEFYGFSSAGTALALPEVAGYTVESAYCDGTEVNEDWRMPEGDVEISLALKNKEYAVQYVLNGGEFLKEPKSNFTAGYKQALPAADTVTNGSLSFAGWYDNEELEGDAQTMIPASMTHGAVYYAKWEAPVAISTAEELCSITDLNGHYIMTADIDLTGKVFKPIGSKNEPFAGSFDGNGHTISGLTLDSTDSEQGLFGANAGTIRNVVLSDDCTIYGDMNVGGIAGYNTGLISGCVSNALIASAAKPVTNYKIWSQNLCTWGGDNRKPVMLQRLNAIQPDLACFQEGSEAWMSYIQKNFTGYTLFYKFRGDKESTPVMWKTDRFEVMESGHFWLSETPEKQSMGWDAACYRICSWAVLKDKQTGDLMAMYSIHLDHVGAVARREGCLVVRDRIYDLRERYPGIMLFAAGDFNCGMDSEAYKVFTTGGMADARYMTDNTTDKMTHGDINSGVTTSYIDFITTYEDAVNVTEFRVLDESYNGLYPSDHAGLLATFHAKRSRNYGSLAGNNEGIVSDSVADAVVVGNENSGIAVGLNNGTVEDVFYEKGAEIPIAASGPVGTGVDTDCFPLHQADLYTLYELNREAGMDVLALRDGKVVPAGDRTTGIPVKITIGKRDEYLLSGGSLTIDTAGFSNPVVTMNGVLLKDLNITVPNEDTVITLQENTACAQHDFSLYTSADDEKHHIVCANNPAHFLEESHEFENRQVNAGCYDSGMTADVCKQCGYMKNIQEQPKEGHVFAGWQPYDENDHQRICTKDPTHIEYAAHEFGEPVYYAPGCGEFGVNRYTCSCGYYYDEVVTMRRGTSHMWETETVKPDCENPGGLRTYCDACGRSEIEITETALGHAWSDWQSINETTHKSSCGNNKDHVRTAAHKMDGGVVYAPACGVKGYTRYSCIECDYYTDTDFLPALDHEWGPWWVEQPAQGDNSGLKKRQCSICKEYDTRVIPGNLDPAVVAGVVFPEDGYLTVTVKLRNNPGLASLQLAMTYDPEVLQPLGDAVEKGSALGSLTFGSGLEGNPCGAFKMTWVGAANDTSNGTLFTVTFKVLKSGDTTVTLEVVPNTAFDEKLNPVTIYDRYAESVEVHSHNFVWNEETGRFECSCGGVGLNDGDVDRNGTLDTADVILILQHLTGQTGLRMDMNAADFNGDGRVSVADAVQILRYISA